MDGDYDHVIGMWIPDIFRSVWVVLIGTKGRRCAGGVRSVLAPVAGAQWAAVKGAGVVGKQRRGIRETGRDQGGGRRAPSEVSVGALDIVLFIWLFILYF